MNRRARPGLAGQAGAGRSRQVRAWEAEYRRPGKAGIESSYTLRAERCVLRFLSRLRRQGVHRGKLLDLGCGRGRNSLPFLRAGWVVCGLDAAAPALRDFRRLARAGKRLRLLRGDLGAPLPYPDAVFDAVLEITAADNLGAGRGFHRLWRETARVLKPGGWLLSYHFTPADGYYGPRLRASAQRRQGRLYDRQAGMHFRFYTAGDIAAAAGGRLALRGSRAYRYRAPMFGRRLRRSLRAAVFQRIPIGEP